MLQYTTAVINITCDDSQCYVYCLSFLKFHQLLLCIKFLAKIGIGLHKCNIFYVHVKILYSYIKHSLQFDSIQVQWILQPFAWKKMRYNDKLLKNIVFKAFVRLITAKFRFFSQKSSDKSIHINYNVTDSK